MPFYTCTHYWIDCVYFRVLSPSVPVWRLLAYRNFHREWSTQPSFIQWCVHQSPSLRVATSTSPYSFSSCTRPSWELVLPTMAFYNETTPHSVESPSPCLFHRCLCTHRETKSDSVCAIFYQLSFIDHLIWSVGYLNAIVGVYFITFTVLWSWCRSYGIPVYCVFNVQGWNFLWTIPLQLKKTHQIMRNHPPGRCRFRPEAMLLARWF